MVGREWLSVLTEIDLGVELGKRRARRRVVEGETTAGFNDLTRSIVIIR